MTDTDWTIDRSGWLRGPDGIARYAFIDSFITAEGVWEKATAVIFRLYDSSEVPNVPGGKSPSNASWQFRMSATRARSLARALIDVADEIEGRGKARN